MQTIEDIKKLNIPVAQISKEQFNAKPITSWNISPKKIVNGFLKLDSFKGEYDSDFWDWGLSVNPRTNLSTIMNEIENRTAEDPYNDIFLFTIKFRATGGIEYRLKIKQTYVYRDPKPHYMYIKKGGYITKIQMTGLEFNYIFKESRSQEIQISFSGAIIIDDSSRNVGIWWPVRAQNIQIDRIN